MSIVVAYIPTKQGRAALKLAAAEAELRSQRLVLVDSHQPAEYDGETALATLDDIKEIRKRLDKLGVRHEEHVYVRGNSPLEDIVQAAADHDAQLVVVGVRRRRGLKRLRRSLVLEIINRVQCPVLCVHSGDTEKTPQG